MKIRTLLIMPAAACLMLCATAAHAADVLVPPYTLNLTDETERASYTIIDANGDGETWAGSKYYFRCHTAGEKQADDWLISPGISLEEGSTYTITYTGHNKQSDKPERVTLLAGTSPTAEAMTITVMPTITFTSVQKELHTATFKAPSTGTYYFGFHCTSDAGMYYAYVDGWGISSPAGKQSPDSVTSLKVTPADKGALQATISFKTPTTNADGSAIESLTKATVYNATTNATVGTVEAPATGAELSVVDNNPKNGLNTYRVYCTSANGDGVASDAKAFVGIDVPKAVGRGNWTQQGRNVVLTWPAPSEKGVNGGYVDTAAVTYTVTMLQPQYQELVSGLRGTTYTDTSLAEISGQKFASYAITPKSKAGEGQGSPTFSGPFGTPFDAPIAESFAQGKLAYSPWFIIDHSGDDNSSWDIVSNGTYPSRTPQDADAGMALMSTNGDGSHTLASPMFKLGDGYVLKFWISNPDRYNSLSLLISSDQCHNWTKVRTLPVTKENWEEQTVDLSAYNGQSICIGFRGEVEEYNKQIAVDNISIVAGETSVDKIDTDTQAALITVNGNVLTVTAASGTPVAVFDTVGRRVAAGTGTVSKELPQGVYVVLAGNSSNKVVVR